MALVMAYSLRPSWRSISLKVPIQPEIRTIIIMMKEMKEEGEGEGKSWRRKER